MEKYKIPTVRFCEFSGDIPREELHKFHWAPAEGALLAAGIRTLEGQPIIDPDLLSLAKVSKWRIADSIYLYEQWSKEHDPLQPIHPSEFLSWLAENPLPKLDYRREKIETIGTSTRSANTTKEAKESSASNSLETPQKATRDTELKEYVEAAIKEAGSDGAEVPPINSATGNLVKSVFEKENGLEEAVFRRADHRFFAAGGSRHTDQGTVSATWFQ